MLMFKRISFGDPSSQSKAIDHGSVLRSNVTATVSWQESRSGRGYLLDGLDLECPNPNSLFNPFASFICILELLSYISYLA